MKKILSLLFFFGSIATQAQTIKGWVVSEKDRTPVEYATISLLRLPDSSVVTGISSQASGMFLFENVKAGKYFIKADFLGYQSSGKSIDMKADIKNITIDTIYLKVTSSKIDEITVTGEKIKGKELVDRTVYAIPANISKSSVNGYDVLKKIPSIQVDINDNVTLNGTTNFIIQVDGKIRDQQFLAKLLPSDIESIEVINNPSGKYEGTIDGVINVILKKEARFGLSGNFSLGVRTYKEFTGYTNGSLDYGLGKIRLYLTGYSWDQNLSVFSTGNYNYNSDSISNGSGNGQFHLSANSINTGFDYNINDKNTLNLNLNFKPVKQDINTDSWGTISGINKIIKDTLHSPGTQNTSSHEYNVSLFYRKQYPKPIQELTAELRYYNFNSILANDNSRYFFIVNHKTASDSLIDDEVNLNNRFAYTAKIDYVYPIGISARLESGYQLYYQDINYKYFLNSFGNNNFLYSEVRNAAYMGIIWNYKKLGLSGTARPELSNIDINNTSSTHYLCLLPSANLQYKFSGKQNIKLTFNRRIVRPGIGDLYPYVKSSGQVFTEGNPYLKPEFDDKIQLTYTVNLGKNYISPNIYYIMISNKIGQENFIQNIPLLDGQILKNTTLAISQNILSGYEQGIGLNAMLWFFNINARVYQGYYNAFTYNNGTAVVSNPSIKYYSFALNSYMYGELIYKINAFAFINYNGPSVNAESTTTSTAFYGFGAKRTFGNHTFQFFYLLPFSKDITLSRTTTSYQQYNSNTSYGFDVSYYIQVGYTFKFNKGHSVKKVIHEEESESDIKTQGIGR
jgi:hypothetical protein